ncbi:type 1 glutamine amidotransferase [Shewanella phaeophyticola]|uniref:Gamma-glutamyl-gamma-aminobutyrate hydrolase family protein n=1 Tax=Shewanella phaeophyticola TaxID=2978345 RepID=A0ABT2P6X9_9GAMM|nr:gamma-glutamyl-gamma-aminobutyrate hydrolase family protein [Shewanella sp. KJ10-1]MCT8988413.1 gamma-glutamyl-gamma-aminobutyrate hydrolase family protein [Shewanella sp. KJ10-1]
MNVADNPSWMRAECALINQALELPRPILAICLGAQLLAMQLGGQVIEMAAPELGWQDITFNDGSVLSVPQWHEQGVTLPQHIAILASSGQCPVQMYRHQHAIGLQFHPEWDDKQIEQLAEFFADECPITMGYTLNNIKPNSANFYLSYWMRNLCELIIFTQVSPCCITTWLARTYSATRTN